jgi:hypothetical protein
MSADKERAVSDKYSGTFVSKAICIHPDLSSTEKLVAGEVDGLTTEEGPCRASNAKFSMFGLSEHGADNILTKLTSKGIVVRLGFHRVYVERVVAPEYSRNPELSRRWIKLRVGENNYHKTRVHQKMNSRIHQKMHPGHVTDSEGAPKDESRVHQKMNRGFNKRCIEGSPKDEPEIFSEISYEKSKEKASPSPSRERSTVLEPPHSPEEKPFAVAEDGKEEEEKPKQLTPKKEVADKEIFQKPTLEQFAGYGRSKGISDQDSSDQFEIWDAANWHDGNGTRIRNWKSKLLTFQKIANLPSDKKSRTTNETKPTKRRGFTDRLGINPNHCHSTRTPSAACCTA